MKKQEAIEAIVRAKCEVVDFVEDLQKEYNRQQQVRIMTKKKYPPYPVPTDHPVFIGGDGYDINFADAEEQFAPAFSMFGVVFLDKCYLHGAFPILVYEFVTQDLVKHCETVFRLQRSIKKGCDGVLTRHFRNHGFRNSVKPYIAVKVMGYRTYVCIARDETAFALINQWQITWKQK